MDYYVDMLECLTNKTIELSSSSTTTSSATPFSSENANLLLIILPGALKEEGSDWFSISNPTVAKASKFRLAQTLDTKEFVIRRSIISI